MIPLGPHQIAVLTMTIMTKRRLRNHSKTRGNCFNGTREENGEVSIQPFLLAFLTRQKSAPNIYQKGQRGEKMRFINLVFGPSGPCRRAVLAPSCARVRFPEPGEAFVLLGSGLTLLGGGLGGDEGGAGQRRWLACRASERRPSVLCVLHHSPSLSPLARVRHR